MPPNRHIPFEKGGWGAAIITTVAAALLFAGAFFIHKATYRHPTDVMARTYPHDDGAHGGAEHGNSAGGTSPAGSAGHAGEGAHGGAAPEAKSGGGH